MRGDPQPIRFDEIEVEFAPAAAIAVSFKLPPGSPGQVTVLSQLDDEHGYWLCTELDAPMLRSVIASLQGHLDEMEG